MFKNSFDPKTGAPIITGEGSEGQFLSEAGMMVIIMHEFLHPVMEHEDMASKAIQEDMSLTLQKLNPNLSAAKANALTWLGLEETNAFKAMSPIQQKNIKSIINQVGYQPKENTNTSSDNERNKIESTSKENQTNGCNINYEEPQCED